MKHCHWKKLGVMLKTSLTFLLIGAFLTGCATLPPMKSIKSTKDILGTWVGPWTSDSGSVRITTVTITGNGKISLKNEMIDRNRNFRIKDGKAIMGKGKLTLYEGEGRRILVLRNKNGTGKYTQVK